MGGAVTASVSDPTALRWNPAGLASVERYAVSSQFASYLGQTGYQHLGLAAPVPGRPGRAGLDVTYMSVGSIDRTDASGNDAGSFNPTNLAVGFGYAESLGPWRLGGALRYIQTKIVNAASTFSLDLGTRLSLGRRMDLGLAARNLGPGLKFGERDPLPTTIQAGAAFRATDSLLAALDLSFPRDSQPALHAGVESGLYRTPSLKFLGRAGYTSRTLHVKGLAGPSLGLGLSWALSGGWLGLDYGLAPTGELGVTHLVSFQYSWGKKRSSP